MIRREDYTDDEWAELLARCKLLTEGWHKFELGDWVYYKETMRTVVGLRLERDRLDLLYPGNQAADHIYFSQGDIIWLPRLDQLVRMEEWQHDFQLSQNYIKGGAGQFLWGIADSVENCLSRAPTPELAALRALQRCEDECDEIINAHAVELDAGDCFELCAGIHLPDANHRCLMHWQEATA